VIRWSQQRYDYTHTHTSNLATIPFTNALTALGHQYLDWRHLFDRGTGSTSAGGTKPSGTADNQHTHLNTCKRHGHSLLKRPCTPAKSTLSGDDLKHHLPTTPQFCMQCLDPASHIASCPQGKHLRLNPASCSICAQARFCCCLLLLLLLPHTTQCIPGTPVAACHLSTPHYCLCCCCCC
jgi:hypothetical protein